MKSRTSKYGTGNTVKMILVVNLKFELDSAAFYCAKLAPLPGSGWGVAESFLCKGSREQDPGLGGHRWFVQTRPGSVAASKLSHACWELGAEG